MEAVGAIIAIIVIIALIYWAIVYWYITLPVVAIGVWLYLNDKKQKAEAKRKAEEEAELQRHEAELQRHKEQQQAYRQQLVVFGEQSMAVFESIPEHLRTAEEHLDQAEVDFAEGVFAPFWDSVEKAARTLGRFDEGVRQISQNSSQYTGLVKKYEADPPKFPLSRQSVVKLTVGTATAERMKAIVRNAQRNFHFATIYEQRKTNQILVAGFTNLAQALDQMTWRITTSIDDLAGSVNAMGSTLNGSLCAIHSRMGEIADTTTKYLQTLSNEASESAAREKKVVEMLDNIQRKRRPSPWDA